MFMVKMNFHRSAFFLCLLSFYSLVCSGQNLIPNGDFEDYTELPNGYGQINRAQGWNNINGYYNFQDYASPDYHHLKSWQFPNALAPYSGEAQSGLLSYWNNFPFNIREYISTNLVEQLSIGKIYRFSFYVSNGNYLNAFHTSCSNGLGAIFTVDPLIQIHNEVVNINPQIQCNDIISAFGEWKYLSFVFKAEGTYKYITIGNFNDDQNTVLACNGQTSAYYYIDKVELIEMNYNLCKGDTMELAYFNTINSYGWALADNPSEILSTQKTFKVSPLVNTTYLFYTSADTISFPVIIVHPLQSVIEHQQPICYGKPLLLNAGNSGASFLWQDQSTNSTFQVTQPGIYYVEISNACGTITDTVRVDTNCVTLLEMPNVFTPNGDGINDLFIPIKTQQINNLTFSIYNRWGNQIAEIKPNMIGWDGKNGGESCPEGVYFWLAIYSDKSEMQYSQKGFVQLIR
jgi:gliding motility-associated-like protein